MKEYIKVFKDALLSGESLSFDEIKASILSDEDEVDMDALDLEKSCKYDKVIHNFLNTLSAPEELIEDVISEDDELSRASMLDLNPLIQDNPIDMDSIEFDGVIPKRKAGYTLKRVVRNGALVWRNIRKKGKRIILTAKQRAALKKLHRKPKTSVSKYQQEKSMKLRAKLGI